MGVPGRSMFSPISEAPPTLTDKRQAADLEKVQPTPGELRLLPCPSCSADSSLLRHSCDWRTTCRLLSVS